MNKTNVKYVLYVKGYEVPVGEFDTKAKLELGKMQYQMFCGNARFEVKEVNH